MAGHGGDRLHLEQGFGIINRLDPVEVGLGLLVR